MPTRLTLVLCAILAALCLTRCDHQVRYRQLPFWVQRHFQQLSEWQHPQKIEVDHSQRKIYWLNKQGEIRAIGANGKNEIVINKGIGAQAGITFISDFTIDERAGILYFTDLMDVNSGQSALKKADLNGNYTEVITTFPTKVPYAVHWDDANEQLYYATRQKGGQTHHLYQLGQSLSLMKTTQKVNDIAAFIKPSSYSPNQGVLVADHLLEYAKQ
ncbi:MAG: hypothetical protein WBA23_16900 [Tunicatimonas sp.]|uniref:hypothetical protein n=1 Tax=Tunicatimonas sp. TaxID=1940096 RepID=UPI003C76F402